MRLFFCLLLMMMLNVKCLFAWFSKGDSGFPGEYLISMSGGAKGLGMGLAQTALDGQVSLGYSNPASIAGLWWQEASFTYIPLFSQGQFTTVSYGYPFNEKNIFGFSVVRLDSGEAEKTNELGENTGTFSAQDTAILACYGRKIADNFQSGVNFKFISQEVDTLSRKSFGLDLGVIYLYSDELSWAVNFVNLIPSKVGDDELPFVPKFGFSKKLFNSRLDVNADIALVNAFKKESSYRWFTGLEYRYFDWLSFRAGLNQKQVSAGLGVSTRQIDIDYAFIYHPMDILHSFSINLRYGFIVTEGERKVKNDWGKLEQEKKAYFEEKKIEKENINKEIVKLKKEKRLSMKYFRARSYFERKEYDSAKKLLEAIIEEEKNNQEANEMISEIMTRIDTKRIYNNIEEIKVLYNNGYFSEAKKRLEFVFEIQPNNVEARILDYMSSAQLYIEAKKYIDAKGSLIEIIKLAPNNVEALQLLRRVQTILNIYGEK